MASTYSILKFELPANGEQSGTWGTTTNTNIGTAIEQAIVGMATLDSGDFTANVATLTLANTNAAQDARALCLNIAAGAVSAAGTVNVPAIQKPYIVINGSSFTVTVKVSGQTGVAVPAGKRTVVYNNGTDVGSQIDWLGALDITTINATTVDATNVEATNLKAKDGTASMSIADSTGVVSFTANPVLSGGTANGVAYLNGSKVLTTGSALTFDGAILGVNGVSVGRGAGAVATNTAVGVSALSGGSQTGTNNVAIGNAAMAANTSGGANTGVGDRVLTSNTTGGFNTAMGVFALRFNTTGSQNTALGQDALQANTTASSNTAVGYQASYSNTTGTNNVALGYLAGQAITTGSNNTYLGMGAGASSASVSQELHITSATTGVGKGTNTGYINPNSGNMFQGNNTATWAITSDQRLKKNIVDNNNGLSIINQIQVRNFEYRLPEEITEVPQNQAIAKTGIQLGVIAQELQQVLPECVKTESTGVMTVDADNLTWYMLNAIKELKAEFDLYKSTHP